MVHVPCDTSLTGHMVHVTTLTGHMVHVPCDTSLTGHMVHMTTLTGHMVHVPCDTSLTGYMVHVTHLLLDIWYMWQLSLDIWYTYPVTHLLRDIWYTYPVPHLLLDIWYMWHACCWVYFPRDSEHSVWYSCKPRMAVEISTIRHTWLWQVMHHADCHFSKQWQQSTTGEWSVFSTWWKTRDCVVYTDQWVQAVQSAVVPVETAQTPYDQTLAESQLRNITYTNMLNTCRSSQISKVDSTENRNTGYILSTVCYILSPVGNNNWQIVRSLAMV